MKMSKNTLLKKIEQGYRENYCNGEYTLNLVTENKEVSTYVLKYTYETGEEIAITITASYLGQVSFYSNIHHYYISNFNNHTKSVINVMRALFDLIECNKDDMLKWYTVEETADTAQSEEPILDTIISDDNIAYQTAKVTKTKHSVLDVMQCMMCPADREGNRCGGKQWCKQTWKRYDAIVNPEWHHVSLNTLANLDFDMFDEKRQRYFTVYRELQETLTRLRKCKTLESYDNCLMRLMRRKNVMWARGEISNALWHFIEVKLSMQNVESGIWGSYNEKSTGYHKSRRYNKSRA